MIDSEKRYTHRVEVISAQSKSLTFTLYVPKLQSLHVQMYKVGVPIHFTGAGFRIYFPKKNLTFFRRKGLSEKAESRPVFFLRKLSN